jgi:hypothetical protein
LKTDGTFAWARDFGVGTGRSQSITGLGGDAFAVAFGSTLKVARVDAAGGVPTIVSFDTPAKTYVRSVGPLPGGGYVVGAEIERTFPEQDLVLLAMSSTNTIAWQKLFANAGRNFFHSTVTLADGGVLVVGGIRPPGQAAFDGWLARFSSTGTLAWQRTYTPGSAIAFKSAVETANGFRVLGSTTAGLTVLDVAADGAPVRAATYADTGSSVKPAPLGLGATAGGGALVVGVEATTHTYTLVQTEPDLSVGGCADKAFGAPVTVPIVTSATPTVTITNATFAATTATPTSNAITPSTSTATSVTRQDLCTN